MTDEMQARMKQKVIARSRRDYVASLAIERLAREPVPDRLVMDLRGEQETTRDELRAFGMVVR